MTTKKEDKEKIQIISFLLEEAVPKEQNKRKQYLADIALFYTTIFKDKLQHFIGMQMVALSQVGRTEEEYNMFRANINCFRLIDEWMKTSTNEHLGNLEEMRSKFDDDKKFLEEVKNTYDIQ